MNVMLLDINDYFMLFSVIFQFPFYLEMEIKLEDQVRL